MVGGGGRGGGRGGMSFKAEVILGAGEKAPGPCLQPAPTYPPLEHQPSPLAPGPTALAQLAAKLELSSHLPRASLSLSLAYPWDYFPSELRPAHRKRRASANLPHKPNPPPVTNIEQLLADLEKSETAQVKAENGGEGEDERGRGRGGGGEDGGEEVGEELEDESDEEMDDGTDYNQNYFDNGEGYLDEDDDYDDGPTY